jgi:hypothetical protein
MKNNLEEIAKGKDVDFKVNNITRKEALKKAGYLAVSAATTMILLSNPNNVQGQPTTSAPSAPPGV